MKLDMNELNYRLSRIKILVEVAQDYRQNLDDVIIRTNYMNDPTLRANELQLLAHGCERSLPRIDELNTRIIEDLDDLSELLEKIQIEEKEE